MIKQDEKAGLFEVSYYKRNPKTRMPVRAARKHVKTRAEANRIYAELVIQVERKIESQNRENTIPLWRDLVERFCRENRDSDRMTAKTAENYFLCLKAHTFEGWKDRHVDTITTEEIRALIKARVGDKAPTHQKNVLKFIRGVFKYAVELGVINRDPTPDMKFRAGDKIKRVLTEPQAKLLLEKAKVYGWEWYPHVTMAIYTGMRNGELYALTWDKVNLDERKILVDCSWNKKDGFKSTKSGNDRIVEIAPPLLPILAELKLKSADSVYVLPRITQWDEGHQAAALRMFLIGLGLPVVRFHDLRATWATLMLGKGIEPAKVMIMGGWQDLKTMMVYMRKAGISTRGITDCLTLHNPSTQSAQVIEIAGRSNG